MAVELAAWAGILEGEELAHVGREPARQARTAPFPDELHPKVRAALEARGVTELYEHQRAAWDAAARGRARRRRHRHGEREVARLQPPGARRARGRAEEARDLPLPDEGARPGPAPLAHRPEGAARQAGDLRRRHGGRAALADPQVVEPRALEPGHAPRRRPAPPRPLGRRALQPRLRRRRRGARLPRRLRLARRQRAAAAAAARPRLRRRPAVPASPRRRSRTRASSPAR